MLVYRTEIFESAVREHGLEAVVEGVEDRIATALTRAQASRMLKSYERFLVKRSGNFRLIGGVETHGDREIFVWYEVLLRGDAEYMDFTRHSRNLRRTAVQQSDLSAWVDSRLTSELEARQPPLFPEAEKSCWLDVFPQIFDSVSTDDVMVYETADWLRTIADIDETLWLTVLKALAERAELLVADPSGAVSLISGERDLVLAVQCPVAGCLYLLGVWKGQPDVAQAVPPLPIGEAAARHAQRTYPLWLLADDDLWLDVQRGRPLNLALSPEELELLYLIGGRNQSVAELPMFINGQAGSGKSTMLAYVFAGFIKARHDEGARFVPKFVSYSSALVDKARETTKRILRAHRYSNVEYGEIEVDDLFTSWRDYLLDLLPESRRGEFPDSKRIDFNDFKNAWEGHPGKLPARRSRREWPAELVWFVIRSLIKGSDGENDLDPQDYVVELPRDERVVAADVYEAIFKTAYSQWYRPALENLGLWDDQDLVSVVLAETAEREEPWQVAALAVDEAQDFTRRELRLITRATVYTEYRIRRSNTKARPPIVFAGDPLQTLSPTGFRWGAARAGIAEELDAMFGDDAHWPEFHELHQNYRSVERIVQFANFIQLWRSLLFDLRDVRPQVAWSVTQSGLDPQKFILEEVDEAEFIRFTQDTILIVPCEEGGEVEFIRNDPVLRKMFPEASDERPPDTVFSAAGSKGLEFSKVVLFRFGEALEGHGWSRRNIDEPRDLKAEYFFNKLYVAATRATSQLYVVDSARGDESLWQRFSSEGRRALLAESHREGVKGFSEDNLWPLEYGSIIDVLIEGNPRENAVKTRNFARETRNGRKMRQAASYFRRAGERREADECEAQALEFEGRVLEAGRKFIESKSLDEAWRCLWEVAEWGELSDLAALGVGVNPIEVAAVRFMATPEPRLSDLGHFARVAQMSERLPSAGSTAWQEVISRFAAAVVAEESPGAEADWAELAEGCERILDSGNHAMAEPSVWAHWMAGDRRSTRRLLERLALKTSHRMATVRLDLDGLPAGLCYLVELGDRSRVLEYWHQAGRPLTDDWTQWVLEAIATPIHAREHIELLLDLGRVDDAIAAFAAQVRVDYQYVDLVERLVIALVAHDGPLAAIEFTKVVGEMRLGRLSRKDMLGFVISAVAEERQRASWSALSGPALVLHQQAVEILYRESDLRFDRLTEELVRPFGAVIESAGFFSWASRLYERHANSKDPSLRDYCRRRFLLMCTRRLEELKPGVEKDELRARQHRLAGEWRLKIDQRDHRLALAQTPSTPDDQNPRPEGQSGCVSWKYSAADQVLVVKFEDDDEVARVKIPVPSGEPSHSNAQVDREGSQIFISVAGRLVASVSVEQEVRLRTQHEVEDGEDVLVVRLAKPAPTSRTSGGRGQSASTRSRERSPLAPRAAREARPSSKTIKVHELATELGINVNQLNDLARLRGITGKNGNGRLNASQAEAIRQEFSRSIGGSQAADPTPDSPDA